MSAGHRGLHVDRDSPLHRVAPQCKIAATVVFVLAVVATPRDAFTAFAAYGAVISALAVIGRVPPGVLARRAALAAPFLLFLFVLPFVVRGERVEILGVHVAREGLWGAWEIGATALLGLLASVILVATTELTDLLRGLRRLHVPAAITTIAALMVRYLDVTSDELARMRVARVARGDDPRWVWQARGVAATAGSLFVRCYERGERVHLAMVSRGFSASVPALAGSAAPAQHWAAALAVPALAWTMLLAIWWAP